MSRQFFIILFQSLFFVGVVSATVCDDYPNPCLKAQECSARSDFVFEAVFSYIQEVDIVPDSYGKLETQIAKQKTAFLKIEKWIKGERQHEPTQISFPVDKWYCSEIKPIFPELIPEKRYRVYGVHYRSENYCSAYSSPGGEKNLTEIASCVEAIRTEGRYYWLIELI